MIAMLTGKVDRTGEGFIIIDVNGVGYLVFCSSRTLSYLADKIGEISINIETHVREDHIHLYGFASEAEQSWFRLLLTVQGVGAKVCLGILSALSPDNLIQAIASQDQNLIIKAPGVGPKLAARIIAELRDKVDESLLGLSMNISDGKVDDSGSNQLVDDAVSALINLGYGRSRALHAVHQVLAETTEDLSVEILITQGLVELSSNG